MVGAGAGSIRQEEEEDGSLTYIQADDGGLVLGSKRVGGDRRNSLEEDDRQRGNDKVLMILAEVEGGWMPRIFVGLVELVE